MPLFVVRRRTCSTRLLDGLLRAERRDREIVRQPERSHAHARRAVELVKVRAVLVGDEDAAAVVRDADAFGIEARIVA